MNLRRFVVLGVLAWAGCSSGQDQDMNDWQCLIVASNCSGAQSFTLVASN